MSFFEDRPDEIDEREALETDIDINLAGLFAEAMAEEDWDAELAMHYARRAYLLGGADALAKLNKLMDEEK